MSKIKISENNYAVSGNPMSERDLESMIKTAENGQFHSMKYLKEKISEWKQKFKK